MMGLVESLQGHLLNDCTQTVTFSLFFAISMEVVVMNCEQVY